MEVRPLRLEGAYEITLAPREDSRGYFMRVYDEAIFRQHGLATEWVQENQSLSVRKGTVRGLHFQRPPHSEIKLVRALAGRIWDVFVDLRKDSGTYGQWESVELTPENRKMVYIPDGFAHGSCTLADHSVMVYRVSAYYAPDFEGGLLWNDETLGIRWPLKDVHLSAKDKRLPLFKDFVSPF